MDEGARGRFRVLIAVWLITLVALAILFRYQLIPAGAAGAGAGADGYGSTNLRMGAYRLDRWTGEVTFYSEFHSITTQPVPK